MNVDGQDGELVAGNKSRLAVDQGKGICLGNYHGTAGDVRRAPEALLFALSQAAFAEHRVPNRKAVDPERGIDRTFLAERDSSQRQGTILPAELETVFASERSFSNIAHVIPIRGMLSPNPKNY